MKITEILNREQLQISFEVFPPKNDTLKESVFTACEKIASLCPSFISVTYGAGGGTSQYTLALAQKINSAFSVPSLAHLTCVSSSKATVHRQIEALKEAGIKNIMALRGDIPAEGCVNNDYKYAFQLIEEIKSFDNDFCIGGACYPEIHPESNSQNEDIIHLKQKVGAGCDFLTTQMFFDNNLFYAFMYKAREKGVTVPIIPGVMPITNAKQVDRAIKLSNSFMPHRFAALVDKFGNNPMAMRQAGIAYATDQIIDLYANGIKNVHVYTMNKPDIAKQIMANLSDILG